MEPKLLLFPFRRSQFEKRKTVDFQRLEYKFVDSCQIMRFLINAFLFLMCYDVFTRCASYFEVFYYSYMNSFYGKMEVDFMAQWQPSTFTPDKTADTAAYAASLSASATSQSLNRTFLSSLFEQIFNSPSEALSLYNAINGTNYNNPDDLTINTLGSVVYMAMKNDISCVIDMRLNLYEHQSTVNPNMPLRDL